MSIYQTQHPAAGPSSANTPAAGQRCPTDADADTLNRLVTAAVQQQQYSQALHLLNALIDRHPHCATHYSNRGLVHLRLGLPWAALADCEQAVDLEPDLDQAYNNRALCYATLGDLAAALEGYERAVDLNPFNCRARINLGATLRQMGALDEAIDCFDEALVFHQLCEHVYAERGRTYHLRGDWNCAIADYRRALAAAAEDPASLTGLEVVQRVENWMAELLSPSAYA